MKKSILEIYALAVCFIALVCFVVALGIGIYDLIQIASPEFTLNAYEYERHQSNESFRGPPGRALRGIAPAVPVEPTERTEEEEEEAAQRREESFQSALRSERRQGMQSLIQIMIILVIDVLVFVPHWLLARNIRAASISSH